MRFKLLDKAEVLQIHQEQLTEHGGLPGVRDDGLLESALGRADNLIFYGGENVDIIDVAASLAFGLARNHPFSDGNKRTSLVVAITVLELNGRSIETSLDDLLATWQTLAAGGITESELADWLRPRARTVEDVRPTTPTDN